MHDLTSRDQAPSRDPLVLLHGLSGCAAQWNPLLPLLQSEFDVHVLTLAGHPGGPPLVLRAGATAIDTLADAVEAAMTTAGIETASVCGNSLGGWLAIELARRGRTRSVIALAPAGGWYAGTPEQWRIERRMRRNYRAAKLAAPLASLITASPLGRRFALRDVMTRGHALPAVDAATILKNVARCRGYHELVTRLVREAARYNFGATTSPVIVVWGARDRLLPLSRYSRRFRDELPNIEFLTVDNAGHVVMGDAPRAVAHLIRTTREARFATTPRTIDQVTQHLAIPLEPARAARGSRASDDRRVADP